MNITLNRVSEKNTKKQILMEHEKALQMIENLKSSTPNTSSSQTTIISKSKKVNENINIEEIIKYFNKFSNELKEDMSVENSVIQEFKDKIKTKKETIKDVYKSSSETTIDELIKIYNTLIQEQNDNLQLAEDSSKDELSAIKESNNEEREEQTTLHKKKIDEFNLSSLRTDKEDNYNREKSIDKLDKEREVINEENKTQIDDLKESYETKWSQEYKKLEEDKKLQNDAILKAEELKEKFDKDVDSKVTTIVGRQKGNNTYEFRNIEQEYKNKIKLKDTQLENLVEEENILNSQILELQSELTIVQEKAHILATKTIESKSTTHSFQAMKDVAMEQAKSKK